MKYKSLLERDFAKVLDAAKIQYEYEADKIPYVRPSNYNPDWKIGKKTYLETKGEFSPSQRSNMLSFLEQHPDITIIMVFAQANNTLNKKSKMTYGDWCKRHKIKYHNLNAQYDNRTKSYTFKNPLPIKWLTKKNNDN